MNTPASLILKLLQATIEDATKLLEPLRLEQVKPIARKVLGIRKFEISKDAATQKRSLIDQILRAMETERQKRPACAQLGEVIADEESGEAVKITRELVDQVHALSHRLQQAEYSVQRGLVEICCTIKDFKNSRCYLYFGYSSFRKFCDAGQLKVLGQPRTRRWALQMISIIDVLGDDVVKRVSPLPQRQLLKLAQTLNSQGMESTLEELKGSLRLRYTDLEGQEVVLKLPKSAKDVEGWRQAISDLHLQAAQARRESLDAEDTLVTERESWRASGRPCWSRSGSWRARCGKPRGAVRRLWTSWKNWRIPRPSR